MRETKFKAPVARFALTHVAMVAIAMLHVMSARAQGPAEEPALRLKRTPLLSEPVPSVIRKELPSFVFGRSITSRTDLDTIVEGNAELRKGDTVVRSDRLEYYQPEDLAKARGNVFLNKAGNTYEGSQLELKVDAFEGFFIEPNYRFLKNSAHGSADRVDFLDEKRMTIRNATYTTCQRRPGPSWMPEWILSAAAIRIDNEEEVGQADGAVLRFYDVPVLPIPSITFPLSEKRKSGFLPPTFALDNVSGIEVSIPYYWNIAPNRDATLFPAVMSKRGIDLAGEFRYLETDYQGQTRANFMPNDKLRGQNRWGIAATHSGAIASGIPALGPLGVSLNLNRVSDDNYWRDFTRGTTSLTQRLLANEGQLSWGKGNFSASARALKWQTLQDVASPIVPPYDRLPQLTARYSRLNVGSGFDFSVDADYTQFDADRSLTLQPNAKRSVTVAQISRPWLAPGWFLTPKAQLHATNYQFDAPLTTGATAAGRTVPTFSLDSGLVFERDARFFGRAFLQTLEPRAFYTYTPFRDQSKLPNYDSGQNDFNFATIWTENAFAGNDRISDNNLLTLGATTRLLDPDTGAEAARLGLAQRLRFKDQNVTLPGGTPVSDRLSDVLAGAVLNWDPKWSFDSTVQFNPKTRRSVRSTIGGRYTPSNYRVISAAYRLQRGTSEQIDVGWQWPLNDLWGDSGTDRGRGVGLGDGHWYTVGRLNYSLRDKKLVDTIIGFEYDAGCWLGRVVVERLQSSLSTANKKILFQLEFVGFSRLGSNPLQTLRNNIPRYQFLREQVTSPSRFSNYD